MKPIGAMTHFEHIAFELTSSHPLGEVLETISQGLLNLFDASLACIWLGEADGLCKTGQQGCDCSAQDKCLQLKVSTAPHDILQRKNQSLPLSELSWAWMSADAEPVISNDLATDERFTGTQWMHGHGFHSFIGYPLKFRGEMLGFIALFSRNGLPDHALKHITGFANLGILAIKNAQLLNKMNYFKKQLQAERSYLQAEIKLDHSHGNIIGRSEPLKRILAKVEQVAATDTTVLILGETGTGKELIARAIHRCSARKDRPLVKVNCAVLPANLIESELFGHEKGAFTNAHARQPGRFEIADGATIFLDEISELPLELQSKLLRVLQEGEYERLGNPYTCKTDVRVIAASNQNLEEAVKKNRFRKDLYYRLSVFPIMVPPLRERSGDIPLLAYFFVHKFSEKLGKDIRTIPHGVEKALQRHPWPGNVRELENVIERAVINTRGPNLQLADVLMTPLAEDLLQKQMASLEAVEREHILRVLDQTDWRIEGSTGAAKILDLHPSTLRSRMRKIGIKKPPVIFNGSV